MSNRWNRIYVQKPRQHRQLSQQAKEIFAYLHGEQTDPRGVVVELRPGETVTQAITHALGVPPKSRRRWHGAITELVRAGFLFVDGNQATLPNWHERQEWGRRNGPKGPVPSPIRKPETAPESAAPVSDRDTTTTVTEHNRNTTTTVTEPNRDSETEPTAGNHSPALREDPAKILGQARPGQAKKEAISYMDARGTSPGGQDTPHGSQQAARSAESTPPGDGDPSDGERIDERTGELIDLEHERARRAAAEPSEVTEAERLELDEADAEIGADVDWFPPIDDEDLRGVPPGEPPW